VKPAQPGPAAPNPPQVTYYPYPPIYYPPAPPAPTAAAAPLEWWGRTASEVKADNNYSAWHSGGMGSRTVNMRPNATPETQFHVLELDGHTQRVYTLGTIDHAFKGYWGRHNGVSYFVRQP
jgi:hypothetical protein